MNSHLFESLPIGALFLHNPHNELENPSIKIDDQRARTPKGDVIEIAGTVQVYLGYAKPVITDKDGRALLEIIEVLARVEGAI